MKLMTTRYFPFAPTSNACAVSARATSTGVDSSEIPSLGRGG